MATTRHTWLPTLRVWAHIHNHDPPSSSSSNPSTTSPQMWPAHHRSPPPAPPDNCCLLTPTHNHASCPICFGNIAGSRLAVLWWCMHRFCVDCIEKWSLLQRFCPLCKQTFQGWYHNIRGPSDFEKKRLVDLPLSVEPIQSSAASLNARPSRSFGGLRLQNVRSTVSRSYRPSLPVQRKRSFGLSRWSTTARMQRDSESIAVEKALKWRASIYERGLKAVPPRFEGRVHLRQISVDDPEMKARIERRLEPWIRRELQAISGDPDPSLLVHLVLSLWFSVLSQKENNINYCDASATSKMKRGRIASQSFQEDDAIRQLEPFLENKAMPFWHELKCYAECPFTMKAYDSVVVYHKEREDDSLLRDSRHRKLRSRVGPCS